MAISQLNESLRRIVLSGVITEETGAQFLEHITALEYIDHTKPITIYIDTYGGSIDAALLIYDCIRTTSCPINTVGLGKVMSAGTLILSAGDKGHRFIGPHTRAMIHEVSGGSKGTISNMENSINETRRMQDVYATLMAKHTGQKKSKVLEDMKIDNFMSAKQAIEYGLADKLFPSRKIASKSSKKKTKRKTTKKAAKKKSRG